MKRFFITLLSLYVVTAFSQEMIDSNKQEIVFQSVNVIPMDIEQVLENYDVVVANGVIADMGPTGKVKYSRKAHVIPAEGKYLIPGLVEMHAHVPQTEELEPMIEVMTLFAVNGVTTIRSMLGHIKHLELKAKIETGEIIGPTLYTSGPSFNGNSAKAPKETAEMVKEQFSMGYDFLKIHPGVPLASFEALVKTAKKEKIPFAGHVPAEVGIWKAIDSDYQSIDHLDGMIEGLIPNLKSLSEDQVGIFGVYGADKVDISLLPKMMKGLKDHNVWLVPTEALAERWLAFDKTSKELAEAPEMKYIDAAIAQNWISAHEEILKKSTAEGFRKFLELRRRLILEAHKSGVRIVLGSDAPQVFNVPGFSVHHELQYYVNAGLTPFEALQTATVNGAAFFDRPTCGLVMVGGIADLVLLNGNPLKDIKQTQNIEGVMMHTHYLHKDYVEAALKKLVKK
jgi:imidazolonepropionase-like amidohydrolase